MLTAFICVVIAFAVLMAAAYWRAGHRMAAIEAAFPPTGQFVEIAGRKVHVIVEGSGPDLVLIHGAGGNAQDFTYKFTQNLTDRFRVYSVDRPGLGYTDGADGPETPMDQARLLSAAVQQLGARDPIVLGHSYGGAVAMAWGLEEPASAIVILSGATMPWEGPLRPYYRIFGSWIGGVIGAPLVAAFVDEGRVKASVDGVFEPAETDPGYYAGAAIPLALRMETFRVSARQVNTLRPNLVEMSKRYGQMQLPVEILHGTADTSVRPEVHAEPLSKVLPNMTLTLLDGLGHAPHHVTPKPIIDAIDRAADRAGLR